MRHLYPKSQVMVIAEDKPDRRFALGIAQTELAVSGSQVYSVAPGTVDRHIAQSKAAVAISLAIDPNEASSEGYKWTSREDGEGARISLIGGDTAGLIYGVRDFCAAVSLRDGEMEIDVADTDVSPALPHRLFWTWDHSTNWHTEQTGQQEIGAMNYYSKPADGFLNDYTRLIDYASLHRISGVTIYGFLRDNHGGVEAAKEVCRYGKERGVRVIPGVGINAYGGIYWEGNHRYNLSTWLADHPELRAQFDNPPAFHIPEIPDLWFPTTSYTDASCPCKPETLAYHKEAIQWLVETFEIGGINFETGDYGTCSRPECTLKRAPGKSWSLEDQRVVYPALFEAARKLDPDVWIVSEVYWDNILDRDLLSPLEALPDDAIYQYCFNRSYLAKLERSLTAEYVRRLPRTTNILRTHMGSQWNKERYELVADRFARTADIAKISGMRGMTIFGEVSPTSTVNEINYLAFSGFAYERELTWEQFVTRELSPRLGGDEAAGRFLELAAKRENILKRDVQEAESTAKELAGEAHRRWIWLEERLNRRHDMELEK
jgi:hypothetical protein